MMRNLITDVGGVNVGNVGDDRLVSGVTAVIFDAPATCSVDIRGGAPGTRETDLAAPEKTVSGADAIVLSGGSAFGLDAASGVAAWLFEHGRGLAVGAARVPIVPATILFDLNNGGDKSWGRYPPYRELGYEAAQNAGTEFACGSVGAGLGATTADLRGGLGSASMTMGRFTVGALVAVNAVGSLTFAGHPHFRAAPYEVGAEFGGLGLPARLEDEAATPRVKGRRIGNTTLAIVATDARLDKGALRQIASMAQDGFARAIVPVHTPFDGDTIFSVATGRVDPEDGWADIGAIGHAAALCVSRACARAVYCAAPSPNAAIPPSWRERFGARER